MATILVVDDNAVVQRVIGHTLRKAGHDVFTLSHPHEALSAVEQETFDLAILDINMPDMDGVQLMIEMRKRQRSQHVPIVMLTASSVDEDRQRAKAAGANEFLTKPASSHELIGLIDRMLAT